MNYGTKLKELRTSELLPQKDIAKQLGISRSTYKDYELQNKILPIKHLNAICNIFDISIDYLFGFTEQKKYNNCNHNIDLNKQSIHLIEFRKKQKLTQQNLADYLNTTHSVISDYEQKKKIIATPFLYAICSKYQISADYFLGRTDTPKFYR